MASEVTRDFNWVEARSACSPAQVFVELRLAVTDEIKAINKKRNLAGNAAYKISPNSDGTTFVVWRGNDTTPYVKFSFDSTHIEILDEVGGKTHSAMLTLDNNGHCKLKIAGQELEQWQVRHLALEGLLFGSD